MYDKDTTTKYCGIQAFFWMGYAVIMGFVNLYLLSVGYTSGQIGTLMAVGGLLSALLQPVIASLADRSRIFSLKLLTVILSALTLVCAAALLAFRSSMVLSGLFYGLAITLLQSTTSLVNALAMTGKKLPNFGLSRGFGSIAYASIAFGLGYLADFFGATVIPAFMLISFVVLTGILAVYPNVKNETEEGRETATSGSPLVFFQKYPRYAIVLVGCTLLFISHNLLNSFTYQIVVTKGGGSTQMGISMALAAMIEIPPMVFFGKLLKVMKCHNWFRICGIFFMLKSAATLMVTTIPGFYAAQVFQMLGWGIISVSAVYYAKSVMAPRDAVKGQAYYTVSMTLGNVVGSVLGGWIIDLLNVQSMLVFGTTCALIGAVILLIFTQNPEKIHAGAADLANPARD